MMAETDNKLTKHKHTPNTTESAGRSYPFEPSLAS